MNKLVNHKKMDLLKINVKVKSIVGPLSAKPSSIYLSERVEERRDHNANKKLKIERDKMKSNMVN